MKESFPGLLVVTVRIPGRNVALIDQPYANARPVNLIDMRCQRGEKRCGDSSAGNGNVDPHIGVGLVNERAQTGEKCATDGRIQLVDSWKNLERVNRNHVTRLQRTELAAAAPR